MNVKKIISTIIFFSLLWSVSAFSKTTKDCLVYYEEATGILEIPCLEYYDKTGALTEKILYLHLKKINLSDNDYIFELSDSKNSHIQKFISAD